MQSTSINNIYNKYEGQGVWNVFHRHVDKFRLSSISNARRVYYGDISLKGICQWIKVTRMSLIIDRVYLTIALQLQVYTCIYIRQV